MKISDNDCYSFELENMIIFQKSKGIEFLKSSLLDGVDFIKHAIYTRRGGVSKSEFESLNISFDVGDSAECVRENRSIIQNSFGGNYTLYLKQVHGDRVLELTNNFLKSSIIYNKLFIYDSVITNIPGISIAIQTADCQSVLIVDYVKKVIANVHSGWRGSSLNILGKTIKKMVKSFNCNSKNMFVVIGPSLGRCCAEFFNYKKEFTDFFLKYKIGKFNFDFWEISKSQLYEAGIPLDAIDCVSLCTKCNFDLFFSYRENKLTGRFVSLIRILDPS